jgi:hypothetical protein
MNEFSNSTSCTSVSGVPILIAVPVTGSSTVISFDSYIVLLIESFGLNELPQFLQVLSSFMLTSFLFKVSISVEQYTQRIRANFSLQLGQSAIVPSKLSFSFEYIIDLQFMHETKEYTFKHCLLGHLIICALCSLLFLSIMFFSQKQHFQLARHVSHLPHMIFHPSLPPTVVKPCLHSGQ